MRNLLLLLALTLCSVQASAFTFKIATLSPDGSGWMNALRAGAQEIEARTDGRVDFKFYPGGVMGDDQAVLRKMRFGQLHGAAFTNGSLVNHFPDVQVYNLVLKFRDLAEVDYVRERVDPLIIQGLEESGLVTFGLAEIGFAYLMSIEPIRTVEDLRQRKPWTPAGNRVAAETISAFSVTPIPLPIRDVMVALQTGMVDTVAASSVGAIALQWHTQVKYLIDLPLSYIYGALAVDEKAFGKISEADRAIVREVLERVTVELDRLNRKDNISSMAALANQGIEFIEPAAEAVAEIKAMIDPANQRLIETGNLSREMVARVEGYIAEYRAGPAGGAGGR